ncbi:hypothetical protein [Thiobacillus thioparus]|uniref:hypothetical protein n=1 Tax=Thiobacillus thioparus TaxID=931 RepID=UPI0012F8FBAB|nr:hypothetical protein [Thiobacillus thioparus]
MRTEDLAEVYWPAKSATAFNGSAVMSPGAIPVFFSEQYHTGVVVNSVFQCLGV